MTEIGEYLVGAYLEYVEGCERVDYHVHFPGSRGLERLNELDVIGYDYAKHTVFLCEVTTHIRGVLYRNRDFTIHKITDKYRRQTEYAKRWLSDFPNRRFMYWAPVVPKGILDRLIGIDGLELILNNKFSLAVQELQEKARKETHKDENPAFRLLQILGHLRK